MPFLAFDDAEEDSGTEHPEWFIDAPEELDVCVAQRHFEDALTLLQKSKDYINQFVLTNGQLDHVMNEIQRKVNHNLSNTHSYKPDRKLA